ncbi:MAG: PaaI family thioesterase [Bacillota bacterium]|jgi:acyl-coenzyme A thioesterase PaaI-like protein
MIHMYNTYESMCFACGKQNPIGLKLQFREENDEYITVFTPGKEHQGYPGIIHGGITATILDEVCARYVFAKGVPAFTAALNVRYRKGIPIGEPVTFKSWIVNHKGRLFNVEAKAILKDGTVAAEAYAKIMKAKKLEVTE